MLVKAFDVFINPEAVGWIKIKSENKTNDEEHSIRRETISVFAHNGVIILETVKRLYVDNDETRKEHFNEINEILKRLGYQGPPFI